MVAEDRRSVQEVRDIAKRKARKEVEEEKKQRQLKAEEKRKHRTRQNERGDPQESHAQSPHEDPQEARRNIKTKTLQQNDTAKKTLKNEEKPILDTQATGASRALQGEQAASS